MTGDDITRLADKWDAQAEQVGDPSAQAGQLRQCAHELRQLAQQGKAGGVAEIPTGTKVSVDVSTGDEDFEHRIFATVIGVERGEKPVILCEEESRNFAPPANSPESGVTDEIVERVAIAVSNVMRPHPDPRAYWEWLHEEERAKRRDIACAAIAAMAQQPKPPEANGEPDHSS